MCVGGYSNEQILDTIIKNMHNIKKGDIVFVNFSFFVRGCWYDNKTKKVKATNQFYSEMYSENFFKDITDDSILSLITYYLNNTSDYAHRLFTLINSLFEYLRLIGVNIFFIHIDDQNIADDLIKVGTNIKFKNGFGKWLMQYGLHNEEENHYTAGIQPALTYTILKKTNNMTSIDMQYIEITIDDINECNDTNTQKLL